MEVISLYIYINTYEETVLVKQRLNEGMITLEGMIFT